MKIKNNKAFTLIELLVVASIICLLASIVLVALSDARRKSRDTAKVSSLLQIRAALQLYNTDKGYYPRSAAFPSALTTGGYIPSIDTSGMRYFGLLANNINCNVLDSLCASYHLGIILEGTDNAVLTSDKDSADVFDGNSTDCAGANHGTDKCYDIEP